MGKIRYSLWNTLVKLQIPIRYLSECTGQLDKQVESAEISGLKKVILKP